MSHSTGYLQLSLAITPKFIETFRICKEFFAEHFDNNFFQNKFCFDEDNGQTRKVHFFKKKTETCVFIETAIKIPLFFSWISKLITYLDLSWKTALESVGIRRDLMHFIWSTRSLSNALEKLNLGKNQPQSWNEREWWHKPFDRTKLALQDALFSLFHTINLERNKSQQYFKLQFFSKILMNLFIKSDRLVRSRCF